MRIARGLFATAVSRSGRPRVEASVMALLADARDLLAARCYPEALEKFDAALAKAPGSGLATFGRALCLVRVGRVEEGADALARAMTDSADARRAAIQLAGTSVRRRDSAGAFAILGLVLAVAPETAEEIHREAALRPLLDHPEFLQMLGRL